MFWENKTLVSIVDITQRGLWWKYYVRGERYRYTTLIKKRTKFSSNTVYWKSYMRKDFHNIWGNAQVLNVIFASKRNKAKRNSSLFFRFFSLFFAFFRLIFVSLRFFRLIFAYFTLVFASDFWCFTSKRIMWNQAFFSLPSETKFSLQFQISLPKRKWGCTLVSTKNSSVQFCLFYCRRRRRTWSRCATTTTATQLATSRSPSCLSPPLLSSPSPRCCSCVSVATFAAML